MQLCLFGPALLLAFSLLKETHRGEAAATNQPQVANISYQAVVKTIAHAVFSFVSPISFEKTLTNFVLVVAAPKDMQSILSTAIGSPLQKRLS